MAKATAENIENKAEQKPQYAYVELLLPEGLHIEGEGKDRKEEMRRSKSYMPIGITNFEDEVKNIDRVRKRGAAVLSYGNLELVAKLDRRAALKDYLDGFIASPEMKARA